MHLLPGCFFSVEVSNIARRLILAYLHMSTDFLDDFAVYCTISDVVSCKYFEKSVNQISNWGDRNGFRFSPPKIVAVAMFFKFFEK